jgi:hypothetical protein
MVEKNGREHEYSWLVPSLADKEADHSEKESSAQGSYQVYLRSIN